MDEQDIRFDFRNALADAVGEEHGVSERELAELAEPLSRGHDRLGELRRSGQVAFFDLPYREGSVARVKKVANAAAGQFGAVVVLGIGGSALGTIALRSALCHPLYNELPPAVRTGPRLYVEDNVDPVRLKAVFDLIEPTRTLFVVISKSGTTVETLSQLLFIRSLLEGGLKRNVIVITDQKESALRGIADAECRAVLEVPAGVGG
ncbi:MAG: glucose-6-phosphate isomerase, partial [Planctomycetota bacterium]